MKAVSSGAQRVAFLDVVGQPFHDARQVAGVLAGLDQRAIDGRKVARARGQRIGKALAAAYIGAHGREGIGDVLFSACSTVAVSAASSGRPAASRLASWRVAQARSLSDSLGPNSSIWPRLAAASRSSSAVRPCARSWARAERAESATSVPRWMAPWASAASKRKFAMVSPYPSA